MKHNGTDGRQTNNGKSLKLKAESKKTLCPMRPAQRQTNNEQRKKLKNQAESKKHHALCALLNAKRPSPTAKRFTPTKSSCQRKNVEIFPEIGS